MIIVIKARTVVSSGGRARIRKGHREGPQGPAELLIYHPCGAYVALTGNSASRASVFHARFSAWLSHLMFCFKQKREMDEETEAERP